MFWKFEELSSLFCHQDRTIIYLSKINATKVKIYEQVLRDNWRKYDRAGNFINKRAEE